jgi:transcription elongation factor GreA
MEEGLRMHNYLTQEAIDKMKKEIEYRKVVLRYKILEDVKEARAQGDLSENFEYKAAKKERGKNESRIRYLEKMIRTAKIIEDSTASDEVGIGKTVSIRFLNDNEVEEFEIVTTVEIDPLNNKISIESPLGRAIYKHKVGDEVKVQSIDGEYTAKIENVTVK